MTHFLFARLASALVVILGVSCLVFLLIHLVPGDPVEVMLGESAQPSDREMLRAALGLDRPLLEQLWHYFTALAHGDLGTSLHSRRPIVELLAERIPATVQLAVTALGVALALALPLGVTAALYRGSGLDRGAMALALFGMSVPNFWLGPLLILLFSMGLGWLPVSGREGPTSLILPALTLGTGMAAILARMLRSALLEVLSEDYVRTAYAKGLSPTAVVLRHALPNAALPVVTLLGLQLGALLGGAVITETVFSWPGLGSLMVEAINRRDYPVVQGCVLLISLVYVGVNTLTDLVYAALDPRVRQGTTE
ncbi:glutathione ABC transporter membrane subunit GsiC [Gammaproteobacteria bacterium]